MVHGITFETERGAQFTTDDLYLVPDGRPVIAPPPVKTNIVEIPGASGALDLSRTLTGYPTYGNREGDLNFHVLNDKPLSWIELYNILMYRLHGVKCKVFLEDEPDYYYYGTLSIGEWISNNDGTWSDVTIHYVLDPYKYNNTEVNISHTCSNNSWTVPLTDIGTMPTILEITVTNIVTQTIVHDNSSSGSSGSSGSNSNDGDDGIIVLDGNGDDSGSSGSGSGSGSSSGGTNTQTVEVTGGLTLTANNVELGITLSKHITTNGTFKFYDMIFSKMNPNNVNSLVISGSGTVGVKYRKGML